MVLHQGMLGQSAAAGINELFAAEPLVPPSSVSLAPPQSLAQANVPLVPTIAFEDVRFSYPGGRGAAHDGLSFTVGAGEKIGIVGPSGSGKSSVARLLLRLFDPQQGRVLIGGRDLKTLDPEAVRRMIAVVHQDTYLFYGTVEENLRLGKPDADHDEIEAAARDANAHEFISLLPQGYQTMIGERGVMLSGGQRQRLAIARALLRDAPILILDEALSSVDAENEAVIQQAIDRLSAGRTTLILAHRLSSVISADRILVLDKGRVVEQGRHAELIRHDGPVSAVDGIAGRRARRRCCARRGSEFPAGGERARADRIGGGDRTGRTRERGRRGRLARYNRYLGADHQAVATALCDRHHLRHRAGRSLYRCRHCQRARRRGSQDRGALRLFVAPIGADRAARRIAALARIVARP